MVLVLCFESARTLGTLCLGSWRLWCSLSELGTLGASLSKLLALTALGLGVSTPGASYFACYLVWIVLLSLNFTLR